MEEELGELGTDFRVEDIDVMDEEFDVAELDEKGCGFDEEDRDFDVAELDKIDCGAGGGVVDGTSVWKSGVTFRGE